MAARREALAMRADGPAEAVTFEAPHPGAADMPRWSAADLPEPPRFGRRSWLGLIGPGLLMAGASIGGGEWLLGPMVTARWGAAMLWLAALSVLAQLVYNLEVARYALYTGEPIFTGKFRTGPGPRLWLPVYLLLDLGAFFPYVAASAAMPLAAVLLGALPDPAQPADRALLRGLGYVVFLTALLPLLFGGRVMRSLKAVMTVKVVLVFAFLIVVTLFHARAGTWLEIAAGFLGFGTLPVAGGGTENAIASLVGGRGLPAIDAAALPTLAALAAIAGLGGLSNASVSNYARDAGWGMGRHVGAIPSAIGGHGIALSHVGAVFDPEAPGARARWRGWLRHVARDQIVVWAPACLLGVALPAVLSLEFLPRGSALANGWAAAAMTAEGVAGRVGTAWGGGAGAVFWYGTLLCGLLVLWPGMTASADGVIRRWIDVLWTASPRLRAWEPGRIKRLYLGVLVGYASCGLVLLSLTAPLTLLVVASNLMNLALGVSCFHTLVVNVRLLPPPLRPGLARRIALAAAGVFFLALGALSAMGAAGLLSRS